MTEVIELITKLISNVGFPIAIAIMLYLQQNKQMKELTEAVNNNTEAIKMVLNRLGGDTNV